MKTVKKIWDVIKLFLVIPLQLIAGIVMFLSIVLFAVATLVNSPSDFMIKLDIVMATVKKIWKDFFDKIKEDKLNKKFNEEL